MYDKGRANPGVPGPFTHDGKCSPDDGRSPSNRSGHFPNLFLAFIFSGEQPDTEPQQAVHISLPFLQANKGEQHVGSIYPVATVRPPDRTGLSGLPTRANRTGPPPGGLKEANTARKEFVTSSIPGRGHAPRVAMVKATATAINTHQQRQKDWKRLLDDLTMDLSRMCRHNRDGSYGTQKNRMRGLTAMASDLRRLGYKLPAARSLKTRHVSALVEHWLRNDLDDATIRNRLRWWAGRLDKPNIVERDNGAYGLANKPDQQPNRAKKLDLAKLNQIRCPYIRASLMLQTAFGLRREEAIKFQPSFAMKANRIALKSTWTKGGRARWIPISSEHQRRVLLDVRRLVKGEGSLIPPAAAMSSS